MSNNNGKGPSWIDTNDTSERYVYKCEEALAIAWEALRKEASEINVPDMGRHAEDAMKKIEELT